MIWSSPAWSMSPYDSLCVSAPMYCMLLSILPLCPAMTIRLIRACAVLIVLVAHVWGNQNLPNSISLVIHMKNASCLYLESVLSKPLSQVSFYEPTSALLRKIIV